MIKQCTGRTIIEVFDSEEHVHKAIGCMWWNLCSIGFLHPLWLTDYVTSHGGRLPASPWYCIYSGTRAGVLTLFRPVYSNSSLIKPRSGCCGLRSVQCTTFSVTYSLLWKLTFCLLFYFWNEPCCKSVFNKLNPHREHCTDAVVQAIVSINFSSISPR